MTTLFMVRHAQSTWNSNRRWQGQADPPLSEHGVAQAQEAAQKIGSVDVIFSSSQQRALQTATIISNAIGVGPVQLADELRERNVGNWSGLTRVEIDKQFPGWMDNGKRPDGWEPDDKILGRVLPALQQIGESFTGGTAMAISHAGVIGAIRRQFNVEDIRVNNLSGFTLSISGDKIEVGEAITLIGEPMTTGNETQT